MKKLTNEQEKSAGIRKNTGIRTYELTQTINGPLPENSELKDWPQQMQDEVYKALEKLANQVMHPVTIVASGWGIDYGEARDGSQDRCYVRVTASEIVAKDQGYEKRLIDAKLALLNGQMH